MQLQGQMIHQAISTAHLSALRGNDTGYTPPPGSPRLPLYFFCNPTVCHHLHPRPPQPNSSPHQNTATDQVRPIGPVFQTSLQGHTLTQHTAIITDSISPAQTVPSLGSVKKHVSHPVHVRSHCSWSGKKHIAYHSRAQPLAWQKHGV